MIRAILLFLIFPLTVLADSQTTGNLITNGDFNNGTTGWTLQGDAQRIGDCCPGGHDLEFGDSGSIEQSFNLTSDVITQPMLNNGITLNSSVEVQNGECGVSGCWGGSGPADTFTIRLQIRDINDNVLSVTTQERTNVTGINGKDFTDISGLKKLGIENVPPLVARGIILDMASYFGVDYLEAGQFFTVEDVKAVEKKQGTPVKKGDVVIFHTGWIDAKLKSDPVAWASGEPGQSPEVAEYLASKQVIAVGADTWGLDVVPPKNINEPDGLFGSFNPDLVLLIAFETAAIASF